MSHAAGMSGPAAHGCREESAARLRAVVDTAVDGIITIGADGIIDTANPAAYRMFGYASGELIGQPVAMLMPEPHRSRHDGYVERYLRTGQARIIGNGRELDARRKDGALFPIDLAISETRVAGRVIFTGIVRDLSERERARRALSEQQQFAATILDTVGALVVVVDPSGTIVRFNRAAEETTDYLEHEVVGTSVWQFVPPAERAAVEQLWTAPHGVSTINEHHWLTRSGVRRLIAWRNTALLAADGAVWHVIGTGLDITDSHAAQKAVADSSERERRRLGREIHDGCGQHLTALSLLAKTLQDDLHDRPRPAEMAGRILTIAQELIADMRRISRGLYPIELARSGLAAALRDLAEGFPDSVGCNCRGFGDGTELDRLPPEVELHLFRIAQEAVSNAVEHAAARSITISLVRSDQGVALSVQDDGCGMPPARERSGIGLLSMEHRARSVGSRLQIASGRSGTRIGCVVAAPPEPRRPSGNRIRPARSTG